MDASEDKRTPGPDQDHLPTVAALATLAICTTTVAHEAFGHGGACLLLGGHITLLNNAFFHCSRYSPLIDGAGPAGNLLVGLAAFAAQSAIPSSNPALRLYALLVSAFSLFWEAGYVIFSMLHNRGDYVDVWHGFVGPTTASVRIACALTGIAAYVVFATLVRFRARSFASPSGRIGRTFRFAWFMAVLAMVVAGAFFAPDRLGAMHDAGLSAAASFPLLLVPSGLRPAQAVARVIARSNAVIAVGAGVFVLFALILGRGLY